MQHCETIVQDTGMVYQCKRRLDRNNYFSLFAKLYVFVKKKVSLKNSMTILINKCNELAILPDMVTVSRNTFSFIYYNLSKAFKNKFKYVLKTEKEKL